MEEAVARLFDSCDEPKSGKVSVSVLINAVRDEDSNSDVDPAKGQELLEAIRQIVDPSDSNLEIDKSTWVAAWKSQEESIDFSGINSSNDCPLNHTNESYQFSPNSSSSDMEELEALRQENRRLMSSEKALREQCLAQEETLAQELTERQDQEKILKEEIAKWIKNYNTSNNLFEDLKGSLDICQKDKDALHNLLFQQEEEKRELKIKLQNLENENASLKMENDDLTRMNESYESQIKSLKAENTELSSSYDAQVQELQESLQNCVTKQNRIDNQRTCTCLIPHKTDYEPNNNLLSELMFSGLNYSLISNGGTKPNNFDSVSGVSEMQVSTLHHHSIMEEMQAVTASFQTDSSFDCSFDMEKDLQAFGGDNFLGVNQAQRDFETAGEHSGAMKGRYRSALDLKSDNLAVQSTCAKGQEMETQSVKTKMQVMDSETQTDNQWENRQSSHQSLQISHSGTQTDDQYETQPTSFHLLPKPTKPHNKCTSIVKAMQTPIPSFHRCCKWFRFLFYIAINIFLLIWGIIIFTAAVLEQAHETGILNPPYQNSAIVPWLRYLVKPFIQIQHGNGHPF